MGSIPPALIPALFAMGELSKGDTFIDIGCGSGKVVLAAAAAQAVHAGEASNSIKHCTWHSPPPL